MKMSKKLIKLGTSKAVILPNSWLDYQAKNGKSTDRVILDAQDDTVVITADEEVEKDTHGEFT
jgi:hypothetical protein